MVYRILPVFHVRPMLISTCGRLAESNQNRGLANPTNITAAELEKWRLGTENGYQNNDYYSAVMDKVAPQQYINASASGGAETMNYYVSVGHVNQDAIIKDYNFNRTNFQANIGAGLAKGLRVGTEISWPFRKSLPEWGTRSGRLF